MHYVMHHVMHYVMHYAAALVTTSTNCPSIGRMLPLETAAITARSTATSLTTAQISAWASQLAGHAGDSGEG